MAAKGFLRRPGIASLYSSLKYFGAWNRHVAPGRNSVADQLPWISFSAIRFLKKIVRPDMRVFEYGSGGSTLFWAHRVKEIVSVEHDKPWFDKLQQEIARQRIGNVTYILAEASPDADFSRKDFIAPRDYISGDVNYKGMNFERYVKTIDAYPDGYFDIISVDGRARPSCVMHALKKLKRGGWLLIDNTERKYYLSSFTFDAPDWQIRVFDGPVPYIYHFSATTVLKKLN